MFFCVFYNAPRQSNVVDWWYSIISWLLMTYWHSLGEKNRNYARQGLTEGLKEGWNGTGEVVPTWPPERRLAFRDIIMMVIIWISLFFVGIMIKAVKGAVMYGTLRFIDFEKIWWFPGIRRCCNHVYVFVSKICIFVGESHKQLCVH